MIRLFDPATGDAKGELIGHQRTVPLLALAEDGRTLVSTSSDMTARVWDLESRMETGKFSGARPLGPIAIDTRRNLVVTGTYGGELQIWRVGDQKVLSTARHLDDPSALALHPTEDLLAAGDGHRQIAVLDSESGNVVSHLVGHRAAVLSVAFSPHGRTLATGAEDGVVKLWHVPTGQELFELHDAALPCRKLQFTDDGLHLVALIGDDQILVFHAE